IQRFIQTFFSLSRCFSSSSFFSSLVWREISSQMKIKMMMNASVYATKRLVMGEDRVFEVLDLFFNSGDGHSAADQIRIEQGESRKRNNHDLPHVPIQPAAKDDRLGMLRAPPPDRQVVERNID